MVSSISYTRLTLALDIIKKLTEGPFAGYHELSIIKQRISLGDTITIKESSSMGITCSDVRIPVDSANICWQAVDVVRSEFGITQNVNIDIEKLIPVQGGLAGGSTNAATVITLLDELWSLGLTYDAKIRLGRKLGMDVPFYFTGGSAFDTEATGTLEPFEHSMKLYFLLVVPPFGVSTAEAYRNIQYEKVGVRKNETAKIKEALQKNNFQEIARLAHNDFEISVFPQYSGLVDIKRELLECGADAAFMSGSGSTMVGMFSSIEKIYDSAEKFSNTIIAESL